MGELLLIRDYLPEPRNHRILNNSSLKRKIGSVLGAAAITLSVTGPLPTARTDYGLETIKTPTTKAAKCEPLPILAESDSDGTEAMVLRKPKHCS